MTTPVDRVISALESRGLTIRGGDGDEWTAQCPSHDDRNPSLSIGVGDDEQVLVCCHAGCLTEDVLRALGLQDRDLFADRQAPTERPARPRGKKQPAPLPADERLDEWAARLSGHQALLDRLWELRGWSADALRALGVGFDGERIVFPIRDHAGRLVNVCRYTPSPRDGERKMLALAGRRRDLFPAPETLGDTAWIVEGESDAVAATALGLPATALPGVEAAKRLDVERFRRFSHVYVLLDCDRQGREARERIAAMLHAAGIDARPLDLDPSHDDGYDLSDWTREAAIDGDAGLESAASLLTCMADTCPPYTPQPAPDTGELLERIMALVRRFVVLPGEAETVALALYVLHSWALDGAHATPYLLVVSPEKRSGKTRLLEVLALLVRAPWHTNSTSEAAMFRKIERDAPTLLLDEIDAVFGSNSERTEPLRAILNSGNRRGVTVTRCAGKEHEVADFSVWCPKVLAGIDKDRRLPDTIRDRSIPIRMRRRHAGEQVARFRERKAAELAAPVHEAAGRWATTHVANLYEAEPRLPDELGDRAADAWEPLLAIAELAGGEWPARALEAALVLSADGEADEASYGTQLLDAIRRTMADRVTIATEELLEIVNDDDDLPFGGWRDGGLDSRSLARLLKPYGIRSRTVRIDDKTPRGYRAEDFADAWMRYLDSSEVSDREAQHAADPQHEIAYEQRDVAHVAHVADPEGIGGRSARTGVERAA